MRNDFSATKASDRYNHVEQIIIQFISNMDNLKVNQYQH